MKIEVLFPEICNLFGDLYNINYLERCLPQAQRVNTPLTGEPLFLTEEPALIYLGPMSERSQEKVLEKLLFLDKVLDIIHPVYLTEDLQFLRLWYSPEEILDILSGMQFFQLFLCLYLGRRLARCRTTLDDALAALGGVPCVPLRWEGGELLLTAPLDPGQGEILGSVG